MTADELFLFTLEDLEQRAELGNGEYDALQMAALLRKLFLEGAGGLVVTLANRSRQLRLRFTVNDETPPPGIVGWHPNDVFHPNPAWEGNSPIELTRDQFLARVVLVTDSQRVSVRELIKFLAHNYGAIHTTPAGNDKERALRDLAWGSRMTTPAGQYSGPVYALAAVARVVLDALGPLRAQVMSETWPHGRGQGHGLGRHTDPEQRDIRPTQ